MDVSKNEAGAGTFRPDRLSYRLVRWLIAHIFPKVFQAVYGFRIKGEVCRKDVQNGCVSVCNHIHMLDCTMVALAFRDYYLQFLTLASNLKIPFAGPIVKLMGGIPLPADLAGWRAVYARVEKAFADGQVLQIYPEGELIKGCRTLREFKPGAFTFAVKYQKPVIPCVLRFYPRYKKSGARKRDGLEMVILPAVYPKKGLKGKAAAERLQQQVRSCMEEAISRAGQEPDGDERKGAKEYDCSGSN